MVACDVAERPSTRELDAPTLSERDRVELGSVVDAATLRLIDRFVVACFRRAELRAEQDLEDVRSEVLTRLLSSVRSRGAMRIRDLESYLGVAAAHCFIDYLRTRDPSRAAIERRLQSAVVENRHLAIWRYHGVAVVGLVGWRAPGARPLIQLPPLALPESSIRPAALGRSLARLLDDLGAPVARDLLVDRLQELLASCRRAAAPDAPTVAPPQHDELERREFLTRLWREIEMLPPRQRRALLLGARDESGESVLVLLHARRVATAAELAACLQLSREGLYEIWPSLPLDDLRIATLVATSRRQEVINLRKSARERLERRARRW